jgi:hypothetical protein
MSTLTQEEIKRLADYIKILMEIDKKNRKRKKLESHGVQNK